MIYQKSYTSFLHTDYFYSRDYYSHKGINASKSVFYQLAEPHHHRIAGYGMIVVSASLATIGLLFLGIGENVLFGDDIQRAKTLEFEQCKETDFLGEECRKFDGRLKIDQLDSGQQVIVGLEDGVASKMP